MGNCVLFSNSARSSSWGGGEKWTIAAAKAIIAAGGCAYIICRKSSPMEHIAIQNGIKTFQANYSNSLDFLSIIYISKIIKKYRIEAIVCSTNLDIKLAGTAGKLAHIPVISRQGLALIPNTLRYRILITKVVSSIITNTISIKEQYEQYGWFQDKCINVIYNGVEFDDYEASMEKKEALRQSLHIMLNEKVLLSAGRLSKQKGFNYLIETARIAQEHGENWRFFILGTGCLRDELTKLIQAYQLNNIELLGFHEQIRNFYAISDIFLLSSLSEGTPNVVLEAMLRKTPVIATNVNGVKEVIINGENGFSIPKEDPVTMFQTIKELINKPELLEQFSKNGYKTVLERFSMKQFAENFNNYITDVKSGYAKNNHKNS